MEPWREELYHSELYHYGVKGMKWGKHKTPFYKYSDSRRGTVERSIGMYLESRKNNPYPNSISVGYKKGKGGTSVYLHNTKNNTYFDSGETNTGSSRGAFKKTYADDGANYSVNLTVLKSAAKRNVRSISSSAVKKAQSWISSTSSAAKKKVSDIKDKIAWAEKGKQSVSSMGSSKSKKSSLKVESVFPSKSQNPKKYKEQTNRYKNSTTKKSTGKKTVKDYGVSGTFRTYTKRK